MARSKLLPLAEGQLEIMEVVWEGGEVNRRRGVEGPRRAASVARNTVQTVLQRLKDQGWLHSTTDGHAHRYRGPPSRAGPRCGTCSSGLVDVVFAGSTEGMMASLLDRRKVSPEEAARIRALIDQAERKKP